MGSDARVYVFDDARYRERVVPGMLELLAGQAPSWLSTLRELDKQEVGAVLDYVRRNPIDLAGHCDYLKKDLGLEGEASSRAGSPFIGFEGRACRSTTCPERTRCPYHWAQAESFGSPIESLNEVLERAVVQQCLGPSQFVGRTVNASQFYSEILTNLGVAATNHTRVLLERLGRRGFVVGYGFANSDGIHGWLYGDETIELARRLENLNLPRYEPTFAAMEAFRRQKPGPYEVPGISFETLSLSFVRTVAVIAQAEHRGILWGNDLVTYFL
jgi:hypothetical protein